MPCKSGLHIFISKSKILSQFTLYGEKKKTILNNSKQFEITSYTSSLNIECMF